MTTPHRLLPVDGSVVMYMLVRGKDGRPTGYPMTGMFQGGQLEITTYRKAPKAQFLLADDRVCCVVADPVDGSRGVAIRGRAAPAPADGFVAGTQSGQEAAIDVPDEVKQTVRSRLESDKRMVFRISIDSIREIGAS
ncbi:MAG: pyridoxamine 5'-phosphate oxidase family protein [Actinomycetota bacterium]